MSLFKLKNVRNHPSRSGFDLSSKVAFTAKVGEILPVKWCFTMPGDKFELKHQHFTRTQPVNTSAYTRIREYYDWFWVPFHILWRNAPEVIAQIQKNVQHSGSFTGGLSLGNYMPYLSNTSIGDAVACIDVCSSPNNYFGYRRSDLAIKLIQYLRYGNVLSGEHWNDSWPGTTYKGDDYTMKYKWPVALSVFPLLAYKKFCQDYFRYSQWQDSSPYLWNVDYLTGQQNELRIPSSSDSYWNSNTMFDIEYCNWNKDMFMGVLPDAQYGDVSTVPVDFAGGAYVTVPDTNTGAMLNVVAKSAMGGTPGSMIDVSSGSSAANTPLRVTGGVNSMEFDILALRRGEALQRWKEISLNTPMNYRSQIKSHFGVDVGESMAGMSTYIGGSASSLDISEVVNQAFDADSEANIKGKGIGTGSSKETFHCKDWGVLMCMYHAVPLLDYVISAPDSQLFAVQNTDFPIPELDSIGLQSEPVVHFSNSPLEIANPSSVVSPSTTLGYLPRYYPWKTSVDYVLGAFTTTEREWVAPIASTLWSKMLSTLQSGAFIGYNFFKVNPAVLDSIFAVKATSKWDTDTFLINCALDIKVVRNLDYSGMPY